MWKGPVEPIPFPFHCGVLDPIDSPQIAGSRHFDFDESGEWILVVGRYGLLFTWRIDGTDSEVLPRPMVGDEFMRPVKTVIGVAGGFVLVADRQGFPTLAHYDLRTRTCTLHAVDQIGSRVAWQYHADLHAVAGRPARGRPSVAIDLSATGRQAASTSRSAQAAARSDADSAPVPNIGNESTFAGVPWRAHDPTIDPYSGRLSYRYGLGEPKSLTPLSDGQPALKWGRILQCRQGGNILAAQVAGTARSGLYFISMEGAVILGSFSLGGFQGKDSFALLRQGTYFASLLSESQLEVRAVPGCWPAVFVTPKEEVCINFVTLGRSCLVVRGRSEKEPRSVRILRLIRWDQGRLEVVDRNGYGILADLGGALARSRSLSPQALATAGLRYDPMRFVQYLRYPAGSRRGDHGGLLVLVDRYNHLAVVGRKGELLCLFYVATDGVAAWLPDGTCLGPRRLIGGEPTPGAAEQIAAVLRAAELRGGDSR